MSIGRKPCPWWIFGVLGGVLTGWLGPSCWCWPASRQTQPESLLGEDVLQAVTPKWLAWIVTPSISRPGLLVGAVVGWFIIRPVNAVLGWFFQRFNRFFDWMTGAIRRGWSADAAR